MNSTAVGKGWCEGATDVYGTWIHFAWTPQGYARHRRKNPDLMKLEGAAGYTTNSTHSKTGNQHIWIYVDIRSKETIDHLINTLAHEAYHATEALFKYIEQKPEGEPPAYFCGWLANWLYAQIPKSELEHISR